MGREAGGRTKGGHELGGLPLHNFGRDLVHEHHLQRSTPRKITAMAAGHGWRTRSKQQYKGCRWVGIEQGLENSQMGEGLRSKRAPCSDVLLSLAWGNVPYLS
jgi:hypothetical protein